MRARVIGGKYFAEFYRKVRKQEFFKLVKVKIKKQVSEVRNTTVLGRFQGLIKNVLTRFLRCGFFLHGYIHWNETKMPRSSEHHETLPNSRLANNGKPVS